MDHRFTSGYVVNSRMAVSLGYLYELGLADGRGNTQFNDDVSYRLYAVSAGMDITLIKSLSLHLGYIYRRKDFTSELLGDTHLNRHDDSHLGMAEFRYRLNEAASLSASFQRTQRISTVVTRDFDDTIYSLGAAIVFETISGLRRETVRSSAQSSSTRVAQFRELFLQGQHSLCPFPTTSKM